MGAPDLPAPRPLAPPQGVPAPPPHPLARTRGSLPPGNWGLPGLPAPAPGQPRGPCPLAPRLPGQQPEGPRPPGPLTSRPASPNIWAGSGCSNRTLDGPRLRSGPRKVGLGFGRALGLGWAPGGAGPWALADTEVPGPWPQHAAEPQSEGSPGARLAAPLPQPVAEAAGFWTVPAPIVKAIVPWPGPVSEMASEAIVPWAGPAPAMVQGLDLRNLPGTASGDRLPPSLALFSGSLTYPGPFLSPVLPPSSQSVPPAPAHSQPPLFSGALQALAWGTSGPSVPKSQPDGDSSGAGPSSTEGRLAPSSFPTSSAPSPFPSSARLSSPAEPSRSRSPVPDHHRMQQEQPLRVTLDQCRLGLGWRSSFQAYWLFQTALSSEQELDECGMRPGFAARCPTCWEAEEGEFPWVVSLQFSLSHFCSGSILNEWWVLTTASCANFIRNSETLAQVQAGVTDLEDQVRAQLVGIHRVLPYFGLEGPTGLGLILLKEPLRFQPRAGRCLGGPQGAPTPRRNPHAGSRLDPIKGCCGN
ncbi:basic proline-rich protein-like [Sarcophilus harrisii]|uniref:basic proline-rich protein-like n=1 Tax=Sarcophilus harrisii TaxID=9305 RepID=UPI001301F44B|nr:basic proline-rich protein-like [Sarcophilus harrisii]